MSFFAPTKKFTYPYQNSRVKRVCKGGRQVKKFKNSKMRNIILAALLAALCIGLVELIASSHFAPEFYHRVTDPIYRGISIAADACQTGLRTAGQFCRDAGEQVTQLSQRAVDNTMERAAKLWVELTTPQEVPSDEDNPGEESESPGPFDPPASEPPVTEMVEVDGRQILTGGGYDVTYFYQAGEDWAEKPYGTDTIGPYGCGPTVMAMAVASLTDTETDPAIMAAWAVEHGYWAKRSGSYHSIIIGTAQKFGIQAEAFPSRDPADMRRALREGNMLVALVGPGHFTTGGHFILIRGTTLTGDVLVADPNSPERSLETWDPQIILDELSSARDNGAPLWILSMPDS